VELEDALSCDDEVLEEVFQHMDPPLTTVIRVPLLFVAKLRYQLGWFLHLVYDYGIPVFYWAHHQFADAVRKRYLLKYARFYLLFDCQYSNREKNKINAVDCLNVANYI